ncbi:GNAT family N-acetyltransferase [Paenarthrobacter sp. NPDC089316]|uniref:GNAT family N-acetyltransferase n=1 Tax=unclassified Paenarthrobacter TaxID=2634190 RepID=UPI00342621C5
MLPQPTSRLRFREMTPDDLDDMDSLLGDPRVMAYYPAPKTRDEAAAWISWNQAKYARHGYGLWIIETLDGGFAGDCGLTWQNVNGRSELEVGYHVRLDLQGRGYATEAALACLDYARDVVGVGLLVAIIHPSNVASRRVAEHLGMRHLEDDLSGSMVRTVMGVELGAAI